MMISEVYKGVMYLICFLIIITILYYILCPSLHCIGDFVCNISMHTTKTVTQQENEGIVTKTITDRILGVLRDVCFNLIRF